MGIFIDKIEEIKSILSEDNHKLTTPPNGYTRLVSLHDNEITMLVKDKSFKKSISHDGTEFKIFLVGDNWIIADLDRGYFGGAGSTKDKYKTVQEYNKEKTIKVSTGVTLDKLLENIDKSNGRLFSSFNDLMKDAGQPQTIDFIISRDFVAELKKAQKQIGTKDEMETMYKDGIVTIWSEYDKELIAYTSNDKLDKNVRLPYIKQAINEVVVRKDGSAWIKDINLGFIVPSDDPQEPQVPYQNIDFTIKVDLTSVSKELKSLSQTMDINNPKVELNGILIDVSDNMGTLVSTDTRRLAVMEKKISINAPDGQYIVPRFALSPKTTSIELNAKESMIRVQDGEYTKITGLINGKYPDYERIIPSEESVKFWFELDTKKFLSMMKGIKPSHEIKFEFATSGKHSKTINHAKVFSVTDNKKLGEFTISTDKLLDFDMYVRYQYIKDAMIGEESLFKINEGTMPFSITSDGIKTIIMPIIN
jgi:DNA polymerase-3 subunit beta